MVPLALTLGACGAGAQTPQLLSEADAGKTVALKVGDRLEVVLSGNPTTGYSWEIGTVNERILKAVGQPAYRSSSPAAGSGGAFTFSLQAMAAGSTPVQFIYRRPFEKGVAPLKTFEITVTVR
jgi:inhibitor of cysteine peptidase